MAHRTSRLVAVLATVAGACTGPTLRVENPGGHPLFLDGLAAKPGTKPFRYYGTTRWDALPADLPKGRPDWQHRPTSQHVAVPPPVSPWIFPLDFPLELLVRLANGRADATTVVAVEPVAPDPRTETEIANLELAALTQRALQARVAR